MSDKKTNINLDLLSQIQKVDAPPFLYTRIQQRIENVYSPSFTKRLSWSLGLSFVVVMAMSATVIVIKNKELKSETNLAQAMELLPNNTLYK